MGALNGFKKEYSCSDCNLERKEIVFRLTCLHLDTLLQHYIPQKIRNLEKVSSLINKQISEYLLFLPKKQQKSFSYQKFCLMDEKEQLSLMKNLKQLHAFYLVKIDHC